MNKCINSEEGYKSIIVLLSNLRASHSIPRCNQLVTFVIPGYNIALQKLLRRVKALNMYLASAFRISALSGFKNFSAIPSTPKQFATPSEIFAPLKFCPKAIEKLHNNRNLHNNRFCPPEIIPRGKPELYTALVPGSLTKC